MATQAHDHDHTAHAPVDDGQEWSHYARRAYAIRDLLMEKGILTADEIRRQIEIMDAITPALGARAVARAWVDAAFKSRLLADARAAIAELGIETDQLTTLQVIENTPTIHNVVVCTLCSCYPRAILGLPPDWYKSLSYRSRVVVEPRAVLQEFGLDLAPEVEVRVYDSTADIRYLVLPERPARTERLTETALAELVTRDSMIGVSKARTPVTA